MKKSTKYYLRTYRLTNPNDRNSFLKEFLGDYQEKIQLGQLSKAQALKQGTDKLKAITNKVEYTTKWAAAPANIELGSKVKFNCFISAPNDDGHIVDFLQHEEGEVVERPLHRGVILVAYKGERLWVGAGKVNVERGVATFNQPMRKINAGEKADFIANSYFVKVATTDDEIWVPTRDLQVPRDLFTNLRDSFVKKLG